MKTGNAWPEGLHKDQSHFEATFNLDEAWFYYSAVQELQDSDWPVSEAVLIFKKFEIEDVKVAEDARRGTYRILIDDYLVPLSVIRKLESDLADLIKKAKSVDDDTIKYPIIVTLA